MLITTGWALIERRRGSAIALLWKLYGRLARRTGRPAEEIAEDMRRGRYLDAREALDYGLIDEITPRSNESWPSSNPNLKITQAIRACSIPV